MEAAERKYDVLRPGGLMRCCTQTVADLYPDGPAQLGTEGQTLQCKFTDSPNHRMVFRDGGWEWDSEAKEERNEVSPPEETTHGETS
jgi:hypothetical protein